MTNLIIFFLIIPFIFAIFFSGLFFVKNPIITRRIAKYFFIFQLLVSTILYFCIPEIEFSFLNMSFSFDKFDSALLLITNFIFFLISIISKSFVDKAHRLIYSSLIVLLGLINLIILSDNIFILFVSLFWFFLVNYLLYKNLSDKTETDKQFFLGVDIFSLIVPFGLIFGNFLRYFLINDIEFSYSNIIQNIQHIDSCSINLAFVGFSIVIFRLLNFIPFNNLTLANFSSKNSFLNLINILTSTFIGMILLFRVFFIFNYSAYLLQNLIIIYLLVNLVYFSMLLFNQKSFIRFLIYTLPISVGISIVSLFQFNDIGNVTYIYSLFAISISYLFAFFVGALIEKKFNSDKFDNLMKISHQSRSIKFYILIAFLNLAKIPFGVMFSSTFLCLIAIFSKEFDSLLLVISSYVILGVLLILSLNIFNLLYKILIEPNKQYEGLFDVSKSQHFVFLILCFLIILSGILVKYNYMLDINF